MKDRKKQIEEMAKELIIAFGWKFGRPNEFEYIAEYLVEQRYQKLTKDDVVLSKEEYEKLHSFDLAFKILAEPNPVLISAEEYKELKQTRKEIVERIFNDVKQIPIIRKGKTLFIKVEDFSYKINEISTREGVEIKE